MVISFGGFLGNGGGGGSTKVIALSEAGGVTATTLRVPNHAIVKRIIPLMMTENAVAIGSRLPAIRSGTATPKPQNPIRSNFDNLKKRIHFFKKFIRFKISLTVKYINKKIVNFFKISKWLKVSKISKFSISLLNSSILWLIINVY